MWRKCPDGVYRLDCVLEDGVLKFKAEIRVRSSDCYRLFIEGLGSFREPKTLKEVNLILARHRLWPFRETTEQCPQCLACSRKIDLERTLIA